MISLFGNVDGQPGPFFSFRVVRLHDVFDRQLGQHRGRQVHRDAQIDAEFGKCLTGLQRVGQRHFAELDQGRLLRARQEGIGQRQAVLRMARARIGFGAGKLLLGRSILG